jgi:hypothetical protein
MIALIIYATLAVAFLILVVSLLRKPAPQGIDEVVEEKSYCPSVSNGRWLDLSERIFDPSDARWLEEELAFPKLAYALMLDRKQLAIRWLETLQASFDELVRTPEIAPSSESEAKLAGGWHMLWLIVRFKFLVSYALFIVKLFGPYHRLIPSFAWVPFSDGSRRTVPREAMAGSSGSH